MINKLHPYRFEIFFFSQLAILFGTIVVPTDLFENVLSPIFFQVNILAGILLLSKRRKLMWFLVVLLVITAIVFGSELVETKNKRMADFVRMGSYFLFYIVVTFEIIRQVWKAELVDKKVIFGLISGYVSLGLIGFFICLSIEMSHPGSFSGLGFIQTNFLELTDSLMYFSYVTLLTIGYGDIVPITPLAQKTAILIGLAGQFYLVIITGIIVGKYLKHSTTN